jgi:hypothetical protein
MLTHRLRNRSLVIGVLLAMLLTACQSSSISAPESEGESETIEEGAAASELSGEAGTATLRIERSAEINNGDQVWEISAEFPITLYFNPDDTSPIFWSQGLGTGIWTSVDTSPASGITGYTTAIFEAEFEVRGVFNAADCSVEIYVKEMWNPAAEVTTEVGGVVVQSTIDEFIIVTTDTYEYRSIKFPFGVGYEPRDATFGNVDWHAGFTITSLEVPDFTNCGTFEYSEEDIGTPEAED